LEIIFENFLGIFFWIFSVKTRSVAEQPASAFKIRQINKHRGPKSPNTRSLWRRQLHTTANLSSQAEMGDPVIRKNDENENAFKIRQI
jgi:hypothetical protein